MLNENKFCIIIFGILIWLTIFILLKEKDKIISFEAIVNID